MNLTTRHILGTLFVCVIGACSQTAEGDTASNAMPEPEATATPGSEAMSMAVSEPVRIERMYDDDDGETHFETIEVQFNTRSEMLTGPGTTQFFRYAADMVSAWHGTDARKYVVALSGAGFDVEVTDGTVKRFMPGDVLLTDDMDSKGHQTRALGGETLVMFVYTDDLPR